ncbi:hypothetical protein [Desulfolutivibrio sulfoxidireducens]|uniref:hypothetical protein n=1 Tax=Desulfolutivibrio sulfoxidireducens TaxID=2773299 RepID=UPI00159EA652|nr:hypothetical protein [Desulfolutivibrio sulfoxidireducens]QLA18381.1 hypothetical protein GD604_00880 [Desulfolutivibrio sulfoxidireducens]
MQTLSPSPLALQTGYCIARAGLFAVLDTGAVSRPFPLVWRCYDVYSFGPRRIGLAKARFQGHAGVLARPSGAGRPPLPVPSAPRYLADGPEQARRILTRADGPKSPRRELAAIPVATPAHTEPLRFLRTRDPLAMDMELDPALLGCPGIVCLFPFTRDGRACGRPLFVTTRAGELAATFPCGLDPERTDCFLVILLHETCDGAADFLHPLDFGHPGLRYSAGLDRMVLAGTGTPPHGRQAYPPVIANAAPAGDCQEPGARFAALGQAVREAERPGKALSFTAEVRSLHLRLRALETGDKSPDETTLAAFRQDLLGCLERIDAHTMSYRHLELVMPQRGRPEADDAAPLPFAKVFAAYAEASFRARFLGFDMLTHRLAALRRPDLDGEGLMRPTGRVWGPFANRLLALADFRAGPGLVACDPEAGAVFLLDADHGRVTPVPGNWLRPADACPDRDAVLVLDAGTRTVTRLDARGRVLETRDTPRPGRFPDAEPMSVRLAGGAAYFVLRDARRGMLVCARQENARTEVVFECPQTGFVLAGWDVWEGTLVFCNANHASLCVLSPDVGTWSQRGLPVDYPQFQGCRVVGDFAYLICPPLILGYDLRRDRLAFAAHRPGLVTTYPLPRGFHAAGGPGGHRLYLVGDDLILREYLATDPDNGA